MCSTGGEESSGAAGVVSPALGLAAPTSLAARLHDVLDGLLGSDLSALSTDEHTQLVSSLVKAQSRLHAATLDAVGAFDTADVASVSRHRTAKRWLEGRTKLSAGAAAALVRQARAVRDHLPGTRKALAAGQITPQHTSVIATVVRTVGAEHASVAEPILVNLARQADPATVGRATAAILAEVHPDKAEKALQDAYERRGLRVRVVGELGYLDGVFDVESTELFQSTLMPLMRPAGAEDKRTSEQRRADALLDVVRHYLDHADMPVQAGHRPHLSIVLDADQLPPAEGAGEGESEQGMGVRGAGPDVGPGVDPSTGPLAGTSDVDPNPPRSRGWAGVVSLPWTAAAVPASMARRWACDAIVTPVVARLLRRPRLRLPLEANSTGLPLDTDSARLTMAADPAWLPLAVGRSQRTATSAQLKALVVRDGGCIHPGCSRTSAFCDAHHVVHWADGGHTDASNLVLLCRHHHRTLHAGHWTIHPDPGTPGLFWTRDRAGIHSAQTATDRSPPPVLPAA